MASKIFLQDDAHKKNHHKPILPPTVNRYVTILKYLSRQIPWYQMETKNLNQVLSHKETNPEWNIFIKFDSILSKTSGPSDKNGKLTNFKTVTCSSKCVKNDNEQKHLTD